MKSIKEGLNKAIAVLLILSFQAASATQSSDILLGYGTHFAQGKIEYRQFTQHRTWSGVNSHRDEVYWGHSETSPGKFTPNENSRASIYAFKNEALQGLKPLVILSYGNKLYDNGTQPHTNEGRLAFSRYSQWIAKELSPFGVQHFEIWNEWNIGSGTKPRVRRGDARQYVKLVEKTYNAIKEVNSTATVIVGALGDDLPDWPWLRQAIEFGLLKHSDGLSVHLYNHSAKESRAGAPELIQRLYTLDAILKRNGYKDYPIYVTEVGWPNTPLSRLRKYPAAKSTSQWRDALSA